MLNQTREEDKRKGGRWRRNDDRVLLGRGMREKGQRREERGGGEEESEGGKEGERERKRKRGDEG